MNAWWVLLRIAGTSFVVGLTGAVMPGPLLVVTWAEASRRGVRAGPMIVLGHGLLEAALVVGIVLGMGRLLHHPGVVSLMGLTGGAVLCWMATRMIRSPPLDPFPSSVYSFGFPLHPVAAGALISLANPYWTLWWVTVGLGMIAGLAAGTAGGVAFFVGHLMADVTWYGLVAAVAARGRAWLGPAAQARILKLCGGVLLIFGLWFLAVGTRRVAAWRAHTSSRLSLKPLAVPCSPSSQRPVGEAVPP